MKVKANQVVGSLNVHKKPEESNGENSRKRPNDQLCAHFGYPDKKSLIKYKLLVSSKYFIPQKINLMPKSEYFI